MPTRARLVISALIAAGMAASMAATAVSASAAPVHHHPRLASAAAPSRTCPNAPGAASATCPPDFTSTITAGVGSDMCLDVAHSGTANGTNVDIYQCNATSAQRWHFVSLGNPSADIYQIKAEVGDGTMCLDDFGGSSANYSNVDIWQCNGHTSQRWLLNGSAVQVFGSTSGPCLDVYHSGTANFTNVDMYQCNGTAAQSWTINTP